MFRDRQRSNALLRIKIRKFAVALFDLTQFSLVALAIMWLATLSWFDLFNLSVSDWFRGQINVSPDLVLVEQNSLENSVESIIKSLDELKNIKVLAIDNQLSESAKEILSKERFSVITTEADGIYRSNLIYSKLNTERDAEGSYVFYPLQGQPTTKDCVSSYAFAIYSSAQGNGDPCLQNQELIYTKPTSHTPFVAKLLGLSDVNLLPGPGQGTNSFGYSDRIYFTPAVEYNFLRLDDLINHADKFDLAGKVVIIGSGARLRLAADQVNSLLQGAIYKSVSPPINLLLLGLVVLLEIVFFVFNNFNYRFFKDKYKSEPQMVRFFSELKYQGVHFTFEVVTYAVLFVALAATFLIFHFQIPWISIILVLVITRIYLALRNQVSLTRQKASLERAFGRYVNPNLLVQIQENMGEVVLGGERREVTVMFADVRGFTALSEQVSSTELVSLLNRFLNQMSQIVLQNDGTIDKFMGDGLMALWNAPLSDPDHILKAVKASLLMAKELDRFNNSRVIDHRLKMGIGLNTGEVIVGNIGSDYRLEYTAIGSNVNLASRIESLTSKYGCTIMVSEEVYSRLASAQGLLFRLVDIVTVKGHLKPIRLFEPMLDTPENRETKFKYEKAFYFYQNSDWATAYDIWHELSDDQVSLHMIERIMVQYTYHVSAEERWNGVWHWSAK